MNPSPYTLAYTWQAEAQIAEHALWLSSRTSIHADRWFWGIHDAIEGLRTWPSAYPVAEETDAFGFEVRKTTYKSHVILFRVHEASRTVEILAVRHGARRTF